MGTDGNGESRNWFTICRDCAQGQQGEAKRNRSEQMAELCIGSLAETAEETSRAGRTLWQQADHGRKNADPMGGRASWCPFARDLRQLVHPTRLLQVPGSGTQISLCGYSLWKGPSDFEKRTASAGEIRRASQARAPNRRCAWPGADLPSHPDSLQGRTRNVFQLLPNASHP